MLNIAIISPNRNAYSESFIQAHKELLKGRIYYIYTDIDSNNYALDGETLPSPQPIPLWLRLVHAFRRRVLRQQIITPQDSLEEFFRIQKIDVVLAEYGTTGMGILIACKRFSVPLVVHFHGFDASFVLKNNPKFYTQLFEAGVPLVVVSRKMQEMLLAAGASLDKIYYNPYGPHPSFEAIGLKKRSTAPIFLAVGRFVPKKAPYKTLIAFSKVVKLFPEAQLVMVGEGDLLDACKDIATALSISQNVTFAGICDRAKIQEFMRKATAFLQHSVTTSSGDMEGLPVAILEAMLAGLPVISTYHAGIPDAVVHGETGFLCQEGDIDAMANYMTEFCKNADLAYHMGLKGMQRIQANFTLEKHINQLQRLLEQTAITFKW
ncbi:MAG: glycosyltransferase [Bacteroidia bacterium]|nr:glycosyltransferase [Bacteroidia bacterium]